MSALIQHLKDTLEDTMWPDHVELSKGTLRKVIEALEKPKDEIIFCPLCGGQHVDRPTPAEGEVRGGELCIDKPAWDNPPHHVHLCEYCGHKFQFSEHNTNGVLFLQNPSAGADKSQTPCVIPRLLLESVGKAGGVWAFNSLHDPEKGNIILTWGEPKHRNPRWQILKGIKDGTGV